MQFPNSYFEDEVRDGFYVPSIIKRSWAAQLEVLEDIARVCEKHHIRWFADCGTLLGAVRHGGFIPWDDDLDICMMREDYVRFMEIAKKELPSNYQVLNFHDVDFWEMFMRVVNQDRVCFEEAHLRKYHGCPFAVGIDIFPLDYLAPSEEEENLRKELASVILGHVDEIDWDEPLLEETKEYLRGLEELCGVSLNWDQPMKRQLYTLCENLYSLYTGGDTEWVVLMRFWITHNNHKYPRSLFSQTVKLPFETTEILVPAIYDEVLRIEYGDYLRIVQSSGMHDYPFFHLQEEHLIERNGHSIYDYQLSSDDLQAICQERRDPASVTDTVLQLMEQAQESLQKAIDSHFIDAAGDLLELCQNNAIQIGTFLENYRVGQYAAAVKILEEYCEHAYQLHQQLMGREDVRAQAACQDLDELLIRFRSVFKRCEAIRREVVFLPYKASMWGFLESVWKAAVEDPDCDVFVIPVPYYRIATNGTLCEMTYEGDLFPAHVSITHYNDYDIAARHPDTIFIQNPFDEYNAAICVDPVFFARNLRPYTDQIVYIPPFLHDDILPENERALHNLKYFVTMPGVIYADRIIVQSEMLRQTYIDTLTNFVGEDTRALWEERVQRFGSPQYDSAALKSGAIAALPGQWQERIWKKDGIRKKIILYIITVSTLLKHREKALCKLESVLKIFRENQAGIALIWHEHLSVGASLAAIDPQLWADYRKIVDQYISEGWGIYDDTGDLERAISVSDAYYGDGDKAVVRCQRAGLPVMLQNVEIMEE